MNDEFEKQLQQLQNSVSSSFDETQPLFEANTQYGQMNDFGVAASHLLESLSPDNQPLFDQSFPETTMPGNDLFPLIAAPDTSIQPFADSLHAFDNFGEHHLHFASSKEQHHQLSINPFGYVKIDGKDYGQIIGHRIFNQHGFYVGHWKTDGKIYDYHDHLKGWVHPDGHVYAKGKNADLDLEYRAAGGAAEGGAYLLLYWCGGQTD